MTQKIIIFGTVGNCIDILDTINEINEHKGPTFECVGFLDDNEAKRGQVIRGVPVLGPLQTAKQHADCFFVNGIGSPFNFWRRRAIVAKAGVSDDRFATIIHPTASVSKMSTLGPGTVVFQNVTITSNVRIGKQVIILPNTVISHDDVVGDYTCFAAGVCVSGEVIIGASCYMGTNSTVIGNISIGDECMIGMGSVVLHHVPAGSVMVGNPAKILRRTRETGPTPG
jgi:sugar O-acyltransferase (sialic acid O-acetyltransferase NeuD family)